MILTKMLNSELDDLTRRGLRRRLRTVSSASGRSIALDGETIINFSSNNYLGLADHPVLVEAAASKLRRSGVGSTASRLIVGNHDIHDSFERDLATFHRRSSALLFNSGYNANVGVVPTLAGPEDTIFSDALNHASIIDGCRLSRARTVVYPHLDMHALRSLMSECPKGNRFVVTDSIFSMDGDCAPLAELAAVCKQMRATLIVDEAHAVGVFGPNGQGLAARDQVDIDVLVGTLGKAFGGFGAYVAGAEELTQLLLNRARSFIFTTALPPSLVSSAAAALALIQGPEGDQLRVRAATRIKRFREGLAELSLLSPRAGDTPIFPVIVGNDAQVMACSEHLLSQGIYAQGIRPPTVRPGTARLRFALMATHTDDDIDLALHGLKDLLDRRLLSTLETHH